MNWHPSPELRWLFRELRPIARQQVVALLLATASTLLLLVDPLAIRWLIDHGLARKQIWESCFAIIAIFAAYQVRNVLSSVSMFYFADAYQRLVLSLRDKLLQQYSHLPAAFHENTPPGANQYIFQVATNDLAVLSSELFPNMARAVVLAVSVTVVMFTLNARLTCLILPLLPLYVIVHRRCRRRMQDACNRADEELSQMNATSAEHLASMIQIQLLRRQRWQRRLLFHAMARIYRAQAKRIRAEIRFLILNGMITALGTTVVLGYGSYEVIAGTFTVGSLVACYSYMARLLDPLSSLADLQVKWQRAATSIRRIVSILTLKTGLLTENSQRTQGGFSSDIALQTVSFSYNVTSKTLNNLSFCIPTGEHVAIVGVNGAGKSTVAKLIARLYDPQCGRVSIGGRNLSSVDLDVLRESVHYVPHQAVLFNASLGENLRLGDRAITQSAMDRAAVEADLADVIRSLPLGWNEPLGLNGNRLSGGQRQRVAIARAIVRNPRVLVLDEATSSLDASTEARVFQQLVRALPGSTIIAISHRLAALTWVDRILFLQEGRLVAEGSHAQLYRTSTSYKHLFDDSFVADGVNTNI